MSPEQVWLLCLSGAISRLYPAARVFFLSISPAWSRWIAPGRIGFMSTQRRENRRLASCTDRVAAPEWVDTNFPRSDRRNQQRVRLVVLSIRFGSPPLRRAARRRPLLKRLSDDSPDPYPAVFSASPSILAAGSGRHKPPDGKVRWQKRFAFPARRMRRGLRF